MNEGSQDTVDMASMGAPLGLGHLLKVLVVDLAAGTLEAEIPVVVMATVTAMVVETNRPYD